MRQGAPNTRVAGERPPRVKISSRHALDRGFGAVLGHAKSRLTDPIALKQHAGVESGKNDPRFRDLDRSRTTALPSSLPHSTDPVYGGRMLQS